MAYIGFDTSNYTTSVAAYFPEENRLFQKKLLLPVKEGEKGLRQSDAVFHHTVQLLQVFSELFENEKPPVDAVCASAFPRMAEGSYMPCFLVGHNTAKIVASSHNVPFFKTSHQHGHIAAALYGADRLDLLKEKFIAFHVSGGTTEALLVEPDENEIFKCNLVASSLDLKAGQAVDRTGLMLSLRFPCGKQLDELSRKSNKSFNIKPTLKDGNCSLSGIENKCRKMIGDGEKPEDIAKFCIEYIASTLEKMTDYLLQKYGSMPLVYSGGVMSNSIIKERFTEKYGAVFAPAEFSADNAAGVAVIGYLKNKSRR